MRKILLLALSIFSFLAAFAQVDTEFWFAVPYLSEHTNDATYHLIAFAKDESADVKISMPGEPSFTPINRHINENGYQDIVLAANYITAQGQIAAQTGYTTTHGLLIKSTSPIYCYLLITGVNGEAYTLKGKKALGKDFYILSQNTLVNGTSATKYKEAYHTIQIVATEYNTVITYSPSQNVGALCESSSHTITLQKGEAFAFRACSKDADGHLVGTYITSSKPIVVNSTDDSLFVPGLNGKDLAGDQLTPTDFWGTEYIAIGNGSDYEAITIVAKQNSTHVSLDDGTSFTLNKGKVRSIPMGTSLTKYIHSDKPIGVWQMTGQAKEPGGTNLPCLTCTGSNVVKYKRIPGSMEALIHIITLTENSANFTLNGLPIAQTVFNIVDGTNSKYCYASIDATSISADLLEVECSSGLFHMAVIDNYTDNNVEISSCTYGYFSDYGTAHEYDEYRYLTSGGIFKWNGHYESDGFTIRSFTNAGVYRDTLTDRNGCDSICVLHLSTSPYPDNVADIECVVPPMASDFEMKELFKAEEAISVATPLVADIDGDGVTEIISSGWIGGSPKFHANRIQIYDGRNGALKQSITTPVYNLCGYPIAIADVDRDGKCEIFLLASDMYIYAYSGNGTLKWKSSFTLSDRFMPALADVNNDGQVELVCGKYIFKATDGTLLLQLNLEANGMGFGAPNGIATSRGYYSYYMPALTDIDGDGTLELCAGNTIYKMTISNPSGTSGNTFSVLRTAGTISAYTDWNYDGQTFVVDFDNDGDEDICVIGCNHDVTDTSNPYYIDLYIWDGQTSNIIGYARETSLGQNNGGTWCAASMPFAGDLNGDGKPEILFSMYETAMFAYTHDGSQASGVTRMHKHVPFAETVGFTVFDFNMDGKSEIVYRGMDELFVADGTTLNYLCTPIPIHSQTLTEYPVVADVNGDGVAEIVIANSSARTTYIGWLSVYGEVKSGSWSSARPVWNQWAYNSVNVNADLTIPQYQYGVASLYPNGTRPFNSFLAQKPIIDQQGDIFVPAADAAVSTCSQSVVNDSVVITLKYCNNGDANLVAPYEITTYQNEYRGTVVQVDTIKEGLAINECKTINIKVPSLSICKAAIDTAFIIAINDDGHGIAQHGNQQAECDTTNNTYKILLPNDLRRDTAYLNVTISQGESYIFNGHTYTTDTQDTATFVSAAGCDSVCVLDLKVIPYPDNVDDATGCMVPPSTNVWSIRQKAISGVSNIDDCGTTICGDIDVDGQIEILAPIITDDVKFSKIGIFNSQAKAKRIIDVPTCSAFINIAIAKVKVSDSDYKTLIFFLAYDRYLYAYDPNGSQFWKSDQQFTSHSGEAVAIASLSLADFNHDGWTEIYIGPEIFDAATGKRLAKYNGNKGHSDRAWKASRQSYQSVVADVVGDDRLELILGNTACSVNINSRTNETLNSITAFNSVPAANMKMEDNSNIPSTDGHTLLADMDGDGKLDVVVMHIDKTNRIIYIYVWNPRTGSMICTKKITNAAEFGTPNVGDIDHDGNLELNFIIGTYSGETTDANDKIYSLKYNKSTHNLEVFWTLHHDDASGSTGLSLFDFNQDGTMEIVYRDCEHLRIINGSMIHHITGNPVAVPYDLANIPCTSGTGVEYPVIADVDADGEAEIVVVGNGSKLVIYESDLAPWASARSVWNQFAYNITNVNEDLTIPTYLYNNAHIFTDVSSTTRQPFNNFLAQTTTINTQGVPFIAAADVNVSTTTTTTYENDSIKIDLSFCNQGDLQVNAPYCITAYKNAYRGSVLFVDTIKAILPVGDCLSHQVGFPISNVCSDKDINSIVIAVNDDGHGIAQHGNQQAECDTTNNRTSVSLPTDFRCDTTKYTPVICATELPYTFTPTGTIFPVGTTSGRTIIPETNKYGCDSIIAIDLTVNPTLTGDTTATFCNGTSFIWHGTSYPTGGDYPYTYTSKVSGCDSIVTLHLTQLEPTDSVEVVTICTGGSHTWHGHIYTTNTSITETIDNAVGCDSVCTLKLTVLPVLTGDTTASFCNGTPFIWHGTSYPTGGDYPYTYTSKFAPYCDSIVTLHLTQLEPTDSVENVTICHGESHVWHGQTFTASVTKTVTIDNAAGCDSVCTLNLTVLPALTGDTSATFCNGTPFIWHDTPYATGGDYQYTYTSKVAPYCDSIVTLHLTQLEPSDSIENVTLCAGCSHTWHGQTYTASTTITETIPNAAGCDSVCTLNLTILPALSGDTSATFCKGKSFTWHGTQYSIAGHYPYTYTSKVAPYCDSIVTLHLTQLEPTDSVENVTLCYGGSHVWHGQTLTTSTTITETIPNAAGCDSVCTLNLTILPALTGDTSATFCKGTPFIWHGTSYPTGGDYPYTYTSKVAPYCDSIVTLHLTQLEPTDSVENVTLCAGGSHTWHGQTFTTSTTITETIPNAAGCDSVCTLNLTILPPLTGDTSATFCSGKSFTWHGTQYSIAGNYPYTYTSKVAPYCDSIVTLHLTQLEPTDSIENVTLCAGGTHTWHGQTFTSSTTITETIPNAAGCDSVCTLNLTILPALTGDTSATFCNGTPFIWHDTPYATGGDYQYTYTSKVAPYCDSIVTLHLTQLEPTDSIEVVTICYGGSHTWHGHTYTATTTTTETIDNAVGCDSVCTLKLTVLPAITGDTNMTVCDTLLPVTWRGQSITGAGEYYHTATASSGCDSTITLHVTVETCLTPALTCDTLEATFIVPDICADDDSMYIDITYTKGLPVSYNVTFGADAVAQGFQSSYTGNVRITSSTTASISIPIPNDPTNRQVYPKPNVYSIDISILDTCDAYTTWRSQNFLIHYPSWLTLQRWNDVISLYNERYNGGYVFSQIRWFHEGTLLESRGDHDGYIYQRPTLVYGDAYWAELTRADDGVTITTCPIYPVPMTDSTKMDDVTDPYIIVTPTVVTPSNPTVTVKTNICGEYYVYYVDGHLLDKQNFCPKDNHTFTIDIDPCYVRTGLYILVFYGEEGTIKAVKLLVEP